MKFKLDSLEAQLTQEELKSHPSVKAFFEQIERDKKFSSVHKMVSQNATKKPAKDSSANNDTSGGQKAKVSLILYFRVTR